MWLFVDDAQIEQASSTNNGSAKILLSHSGEHSTWVIPGTILAEFEFCLKFCQNHLVNLAGPSAKFDSSGIPGIVQILLDSGRNQWRTVKTSGNEHFSK